MASRTSPISSSKVFAEPNRPCNSPSIFSGWKEANVKIKDRKQWLTIAAVAVVAIFLADRLVLTPLGHAWSDRNKRIGDLRKKVADGKQLITREAALRDR